MKTVSIALVAATLVAGAAPAFADAPSYKEQMTNLYIATGDASIGRLAGLSDRQLTEQKQMRFERQDLD